MRSYTKNPQKIRWVGYCLALFLVLNLIFDLRRGQEKSKPWKRDKSTDAGSANAVRL